MNRCRHAIPKNDIPVKERHKAVTRVQFAQDVVSTKPCAVEKPVFRELLPHGVRDDFLAGWTNETEVNDLPDVGLPPRPYTHTHAHTHTHTARNKHPPSLSFPSRRKRKKKQLKKSCDASLTARAKISAFTHSVTTESQHALRVGAIGPKACVLVSPVSLPHFLTLGGFESEKHGSNKDNSAMLIKRAVVTKHKALNCSAVLSWGRVPAIWDLKRRPCHFIGEMSVARSLASHQGEPGSIPRGFTRSGNVAHVSADRCVFSVYSRFHHCVPSLLHLHLTSPTTSDAVQILQSLTSKPQSSGIVSGDAAVRWVFSGIFRCTRPCITTLLDSHLLSPSSALKTSCGKHATVCGDGNDLESIAQRMFANVIALDVVPGCQHSSVRGSLQSRNSVDFLTAKAVTDSTHKTRKVQIDFWSSKNRWLDYSPPTKATGFDSRWGRPRILACGNRAGRCRWLAGFLGDLPFPPLLQSSAAPYLPRSSLIGSQISSLARSHSRQQAFTIQPRQVGSELLITTNAGTPIPFVSVFPLTTVLVAQHDNGHDAYCAPQRSLLTGHQSLSVKMQRLPSGGLHKRMSLSSKRVATDVISKGSDYKISVELSHTSQGRTVGAESDYVEEGTISHLIVALYVLFQASDAEPMRVKRGEYGAVPEYKGGGTGDPRENPSTTGIVRHDSHIRKSRGDPNRKKLGQRRGAVARALAAHHGDPGPIPGGLTPGSSHVGAVLEDAACRRAFSGHSRFPRPCRSILGPHFMSCPGLRITGHLRSQLESPSLGECCIVLGSLPTRLVIRGKPKSFLCEPPCRGVARGSLSGWRDGRAPGAQTKMFVSFDAPLAVKMTPQS
ncbi:hypothetical protein PR048_028049 [Dryococelus australis]|uniref:Uncharacterized protein n=1 Tax=Dryococelus australis TaxID=614101 RepID=A0ABQ9GI63_9NEOP|nr:hypothetical protein PR048_028049 [Dryococelus australis]